MTNNEFNEVVNALNVYNPIRIENNREIHEWNNLEISFCGNFFTIINGKIPLEVAKKIYNNKYNKFHIRANGMINNPNPNDIAVDDIYLNYLNKLYNRELSINQYHKRGKNANKELKRRPDDNKYITSYHIDTKEGFIIFIDEMTTYIDNKESNKTFIKK